MADARGYTALANEYYDVALHPTCWNFRSASVGLLRLSMLRAAPSKTGFWIEMGAGRSILFDDRKLRLYLPRTVALLDESEQMLQHSREWFGSGGLPLVADARSVPIVSGQASVVVASLADPYNDERFWAEVDRLLAPDGVCYFTTPSFEWSHTYRSSVDEPSDVATFVLRGGSIAVVPSFVYAEHEQTSLIRSAGFRAVHVSHVRYSEVGQPRSSKLDVLRLSDGPVVTLFEARRH